MTDEQFLLLCLLGSFLAIMFGMMLAVMARANNDTDDSEQLEYLSRYSDARRARK